MEKYHHASQVEIVYEQNARQSTAYEPPPPSTAIPNAFASARRRRRSSST
jgi:hypothetical protein